MSNEKIKDSKKSDDEPKNLPVEGETKEEPVHKSKSERRTEAGGERSKDRDRDRDRERERERDRDRERDRIKSRDRDRGRDSDRERERDESDRDRDREKSHRHRSKDRSKDSGWLMDFHHFMNHCPLLHFFQYSSHVNSVLRFLFHGFLMSSTGGHSDKSRHHSSRGSSSICLYLFLWFLHGELDQLTTFLLSQIVITTVLTRQGTRTAIDTIDPF